MARHAHRCGRHRLVRAAADPRRSQAGGRPVQAASAAQPERAEKQKLHRRHRHRRAVVLRLQLDHGDHAALHSGLPRLFRHDQRPGDAARRVRPVHRAVLRRQGTRPSRRASGGADRLDHPAVRHHHDEPDFHDLMDLVGVDLAVRASDRHGIRAYADHHMVAELPGT